MKLDSLHKLYVYELKNLYSGEQQYGAALDELNGRARRPTLRRLLDDQKRAAASHAGRLERLFQTLQFSPGGQKCRALAGLLRTLRKTVDAADGAAARDQALWLGCRRLNAYLASGYRLAQDQAVRLGRQDDAELLAETLGEKVDADAELCGFSLPPEDDPHDAAASRGAAGGAASDWLDGVRSGLGLDASWRGVARGVLIFLGVVAIAATLLSLLPLSAWWVRVFDFPRLQIAGLAAAVLFAYAALARRRRPALILMTLLSVCLAYQLYCIYPYTILKSPQVKDAVRHDAPRFRLMVANVLRDNRNAAGLLDMVRTHRPDLLLTVETDRWWVEQLAALHDIYPHVVSYPLNNTYGMALYSRLELIDPQVKFLVQQDIPSIHSRFRLAPGVEIELYGLHPRPPSPNENYRSTERDAELLVVGKAVQNSVLPVVVAGDMNDVAWSATTKRFQRISDLLDPRIGRGIFSTFHAGYPLLRWPLDHVFHTAHLRLIEMRRLAYFGSDHFPILITLSYEPAGAGEQRKPAAPDQDTMKDVRETIDQARSAN